MSNARPPDRSVADSLEAMSRIYFSSPVARRRDDLPFAIVAVRNAAGEMGEAYLHEVRRSLSAERLSSTVAAVDGGLFHLAPSAGAPSRGVAPERFPGEVRDRLGGNLLFLTLREKGEPIASAILMCADQALLLFTGEIPSLEEAYLFIREMSRARCGIDPLLVAVGDRSDEWLRIAPIRLAEAARCFLGRQPRIFGSEDDMASRLSSLVAGVSRRREPGLLAAAQRLEEALK